jgi:ferredoxin
MITRVHFVSFSPCGGTEKVALCLSRDLPLPKQKYNITLPKFRSEIMSFGKDDLVFLAFPVYGGRMPLYFPSLISSLRGNDTPIVMVAVYGNRTYEGAFLDMHAAALANGFRPIAAIAAIAEHSGNPRFATGRPDAVDADVLAEFGLRALQKAQGGSEIIEAPGAYPQWKLPPGMDVSLHTDLDACTACGLCVDVCPNGAIPSDAPQTTAADKCIACSACIKRCPQQARQVGNAKTKKEFASHLLHAVERKEPELIL